MGTINKFFSQEIISISIPVLLIFCFTSSGASGSNITSTGVVPDPNPPVFTECPTLVILYQICIPVSFTVTVMDQETGSLHLTASGLPPDAEITPALPASGNPVSIDFAYDTNAERIILSSSALPPGAIMIPYLYTIKGILRNYIFNKF